MRILRGASVVAGVVVLLISGVMAVARHGQTPPSWIVFTSDRRGNYDIYRMMPNGAKQQPLTNNPKTDFDPVFSPNGKWIAFGAEHGGSFDLYRMRSDGTDQLLLAQDTARASWSPDGAWILFAFRPEHGWELYRVRPDGSDLEALTEYGGGIWDSWWSPDGAWIVFESSINGGYDLFQMRNDGSGLRLLTENLGNAGSAAWSPDSQWIVFSSTGELYRMRPDGSDQQRLTENTVPDAFPMFSPDGRWIVFESERNGAWGLFRMRPDGSAQQRLTEVPTTVTSAGWSPVYAEWSPDGTWIAYQVGSGGESDIYRMRPDGSDQQQLTDNPGIDMQPQWSPPIESRWRAARGVLIGVALVIAGVVRWPLRTSHP